NEYGPNFAAGIEAYAPKYVRTGTPAYPNGYQGSGVSRNYTGLSLRRAQKYLIPDTAVRTGEDQVRSAVCQIPHSTSTDVQLYIMKRHTWGSRGGSLGWSTIQPYVQPNEVFLFKLIASKRISRGVIEVEVYINDRQVWNITSGEYDESSVYCQ